MKRTGYEFTPQRRRGLALIGANVGGALVGLLLYPSVAVQCGESASAVEFGFQFVFGAFVVLWWVQFVGTWLGWKASSRCSRAVLVALLLVCPVGFSLVFPALGEAARREEALWQARKVRRGENSERHAMENPKPVRIVEDGGSPDKDVPSEGGD